MILSLSCKKLQTVRATDLAPQDLEQVSNNQLLLTEVSLLPTFLELTQLIRMFIIMRSKEQGERKS